MSLTTHVNGFYAQASMLYWEKHSSYQSELENGKYKTISVNNYTVGILQL